MSKRKTFSLTLALTLALAVLSPRSALGSRVLYASVTGTVVPAAPAPASVKEATADEAGAADSAGDAGDARQPERGGNAFVRALTAPFRAIARLFGGGRKSKPEQAKRQTPATPAQDAAATQAPAPAEAKTGDDTAAATPSAQAGGAAQSPEQVQAAVKVEPIESPLSSTPEDAALSRGTQPAEAAGAQAPTGARILRPAAGEAAAELRPKMWIPLIVGVPADPVSQGRALLQHGYIQEAIAELQTAATSVGPDLAEANNLLGLAYDRLGWHRQAAEAYERALAASPKNAVVLANLGYSLYLADDYAGSLRRLKQAAKLAPSEPVISNNLGVVHARLGHYGDAYKHFARASNEYDAHLKLAGILEDQKRDREAVKHYEAALRLQPGASAVLERLVALYERTGARDKADTARRTLGQPRNPQRTATGGGG